MSQSIRVLIGDDTLDLGISWATEFKEAGMYAITRPKQGKLLLDYILTEKPAIAVLDAKTPGIDICDIIKTVRNSNDYNPAIIITANYDSAKVEFEVMDAGADYYMIRPFETKTLVSKTLSIYNDKINGRGISSVDENDIECVVTEIIHQIGIPAHIKGYHYLRTAIIMSVDDPEMINSVTKLMYPTVALAYDTTPSRVERAIRHAIEIAWDRGDVDTLNSYFGYTIHTSRGKPTNSEFVALIADKLRPKFKCSAIYSKNRKPRSEYMNTPTVNV